MSDNDGGQDEKHISAAMRTVAAQRLSDRGALVVDEQCTIAVEQATTIEIEGLGSYVLMCSPFELDALAVGFAHSEGLIDSRDDIKDLTVVPGGPWSTVVRMQLVNPPQGTGSRNLIVSSSCGICGSRNIEDGLTGPCVGDELRVSTAQLLVLAEAMRQRQALFARTGGSHAAAIFDGDGKVNAFAEDIGRHSALDRAIGKCLLAQQPTRGRGVMLSGRVSYEMVGKAARAGLEVMAAVSAPFSLAIDTAEQRNVTICGFVRDDRATVYTHPKRITDWRRSLSDEA